MKYRHWGAVLSLATLNGCGGGGGVNSASSCPLLQPGSCTTPPPSAPAPVPLLEVQTLTTYTSVGGAQKLEETYKLPTPPAGAPTPVPLPPPVKTGELYTAGQLPVGSSAVNISYDPRSAVFAVEFNVEDIKVTPRFQDPAHRTDFGPNITPQGDVPDLAQLLYLESGTSGTDLSDIQTFFYETPGTKTRYVTLAGYVRNFRSGAVDKDFVINRTRGVVAFGNQSRASDVPTKGTATYSGSMLASLVSIDVDSNPGRSRFEWVNGTASVSVDFGKGTVATSFQGKVVPTASVFEGSPFGSMTAPNTGAAFSASGTAKFDTSGLSYAGKIDTASFAGSAVNMAASSLDGTFYGPGAAETGGAFRVVGATPDTRVDFLGAFTGVK